MRTVCILAGRYMYRSFEQLMMDVLIRVGMFYILHKTYGYSLSSVYYCGIECWSNMTTEYNKEQWYIWVGVCKSFYKYNTIHAFVKCFSLKAVRLIYDAFYIRQMYPRNVRLIAWNKPDGVSTRWNAICQNGCQRTRQLRHKRLWIIKTAHANDYL